MIHYLDLKRNNLLATEINGKLSSDEVNMLHGKIHQLLRTNESIRWYFEMNDFKGWTAGGFWEDLKMDVSHAKHYEKIAMVGDKKWQDWISQLMKPFTTADVQYFDLEDKERAKSWIIQ